MSPGSAPRVLSALALIVLLELAACDADPGSGGPGTSGQPATLAGTAWSVVSVGGRSPVPAAVPTLAFTATAVSGEGGCNHFGGPYRYDGATGRIVFGELAMTLMACLEPARNEFESLYFGALGHITQASIDPAGSLLLSGPGVVIVLARRAPGS